MIDFTNPWLQGIMILCTIYFVGKFLVKTIKALVDLSEWLRELRIAKAQAHEFSREWDKIRKSIWMTQENWKDIGLLKTDIEKLKARDTGPSLTTHE